MKLSCFVLLWDEFSFLSKLGFIPLDNIKELRKTEKEKEREFLAWDFPGLDSIYLLCCASTMRSDQAWGETSLVFLFIADSLNPLRAGNFDATLLILWE